MKRRRTNLRICEFCGIPGNKEDMNMKVIAGNEVYWHSESCPIEVKKELKEINEKLSHGDAYDRDEGWEEFDKYIERKYRYKFKSHMREISGFGGKYERTCRDMLRAGLLWWDDHPEADPKFHSYKGIFGILHEDNKDAKRLSKTIVKASNNECTGAMHQAVIQAIFYIHCFGWNKYVVEMSKYV